MAPDRKTSSVVEVKTFPIGVVASRAGVATSALRFYEEQGLIRSERAASGHRRYHADVLRRVAFIQAAQRVGLTLAEIRESLASLPENRTPNRRDWARLSAQWRSRLDDQIGLLQRLRNDLSGCIGCGCLSLSVCALYNPDDVLAAHGPGAHLLLQDVTDLTVGRESRDA
jgi:MerR family transcriptional regulator, redox-sensitive transcriptional activator SoxR